MFYLIEYYFLMSYCLSQSLCQLKKYDTVSCFYTAANHKPLKIIQKRSTRTNFTRISLIFMN